MKNETDGFKHHENLKALIEYSNNKHDVYKHLTNFSQIENIKYSQYLVIWLLKYLLEEEN